MATTVRPAPSFTPNSIKVATTQNFAGAVDYLNAINADEYADMLTEIYGPQVASGMYGLLQMCGAVKEGGDSDTYIYFEDTRNHIIADGTIEATTAGTDAAKIITTSSAHQVRLNDVLLIDQATRVRVSAVPSATTYTVLPFSTWKTTYTANAAVEGRIITNFYGQGTEQPTEYIEPNVNERRNTYNIVKDIYRVTGSQLTNKSWTEIPASEGFPGGWNWSYEGVKKAELRFRDYIEMGGILGANITNTNITDVSGNEGYFEAVEDGGIVSQGYIEDLDDMDSLVVALDKEGTVGANYAWYCNTEQFLKAQRMTAAAGGGEAFSYGLFQNDSDKAIKLGFAGLIVGGYEFSLHRYNMLIDPHLLGGDKKKYIGCMTPMDIGYDKEGKEYYPLEMRYKMLDGYRRDFRSWLTGGVPPAENQTIDTLQHNMVSETTLATRARNRHVLQTLPIS